MRSFLFRLFLFLGCLLTVTFAVNRLTAEREFVPEAGTHILIAGDSQTGGAFDPGLIPGSANVSLSAEPAYVTLRKIEQLLAAFPQFDTIVLGLGYHSLAGTQDRKFEGGDARAKLMYERYGTFYRCWDPPSGGHAKAVTREHLRRLLALGRWGRPRLPYVGGFTANDGNYLAYGNAYLKWTVRRHYEREGLFAGISDDSVRAYRELVEILRERGMRVILVNPPYHPDYLALVPDPIAAAHGELCQELTAAGAEYLDLQSFPLPVEAYFDFDHVNREGARRVSAALHEYLRTGGK